jgi:hypothetical protein
MSQPCSIPLTSSSKEPHPETGHPFPQARQPLELFEEIEFWVGILRKNKSSCKFTQKQRPVYLNILNDVRLSLRPLTLKKLGKL